MLGDIETLDLNTFLGPHRADAILFLDVLEHLHDPAAAIRRVLPFLAPGGRVILAARHVAHAAVRLQFLAGAFAPTSGGLLSPRSICSTAPPFRSCSGMPVCASSMKRALSDRWRKPRFH